MIAMLSACAVRPAPPGSTAEPPALKPASPPKETPRWHPPAPIPKGFDWIRLKSGEWLKGDIKVLRDDSFEFDSDELDTLTLDWSDIAELHSPRPNTIVLVDRRIAYGTLQIRDDTVILGAEDGEMSFTRRELLSIVPGEPSERKYWSGDLSLGMTTQSGNTSQTTANGQARIRRRSAFSRITFNYIGNLGTVNNEQTTNNHQANAKWDLFVSNKWFLTPISLEFYSNRFQNISHQFSPSAGLGYYLFKRSKLKWDFRLTGGWRYTKYESVPAGAPADESTATLIPGTILEWDITKSIEFDLNYKFEIPIPETQNLVHHLVAKLSIDVVGDFDLDVTFQWDRVRNPKPDSEGIIPRNDDFRTSIGLGWNF
jgi:putative salt-induced outer membrane protein YdiY